MRQYIDKSIIKDEIERRISYWHYKPGLIKASYAEEEDKDILSFINSIEVKDTNSVWHEIDEIPQYNLNGVSDFIISSAHGHIEGEAHTYTPSQWSAHIGFNQNRQFRWAYEKDLIDF